MDPWYRSELTTLKHLYLLIPAEQRYQYVSDMWELIHQLDHMQQASDALSVIEFVVLLGKYDRAMVHLYERIQKHE
jgi:hypothetical protein